MDYLQLPSAPGARHLRIPLVTTMKFKPATHFRLFPRERGFRSHGRWTLDRPESEIADFVQSWLYFGLISELCGEELDLADFKVLDQGGHPYITLDPVRRVVGSSSGTA